MVDRTQQPRLVDVPEPCWIRLRKPGDRRWHAARIFRVMGMLVGEISGAPASVDQIWHSGSRITEIEYDALLKATNEPKPF